MSEIVQVQTTVDSQAAADQMAEGLLAERLAACVQVSGPVRSRYWWQAKIESADEWICTAKTTHARLDALIACIRRLHSYDEPEILATSVVGGSDGYLQWVRREVEQQPGEDPSAPSAG